MLKELKKAGQTPSEAQIAGIVKGIAQAELSEEDRALCDRLYALIEEVPKFGNDIRCV